jgi:hypothetical protein
LNSKDSLKDKNENGRTVIKPIFKTRGFEDRNGFIWLTCYTDNVYCLMRVQYAFIAIAGNGDLMCL